MSKGGSANKSISNARAERKDNLETRLDEARTLVADGAFDEGLTLVENLLSAHRRSSRSFSELHNAAIALGGELRDLRRAERNSLEPPEHYERRWRGLRHRLLGLIDDIGPTWTLSSLARPAAQVDLTTDIVVPSQSGLEKTWGRNTLQSLSWLHRGLDAASAVCRVVAPGNLGTGFLLPGGIVMTNNHVVPTAEAAAETVVEFNFQEDASGRNQPITAYQVDAAPGAFATSPVAELDCTLMRLVVPASDAPSIESWGTLSLSDRAVEAGEHVAIVQHPDGGVKKIAVTANEVVNVFGDRLHYMTDTMPGSSGAPVFADDWTVIAVHHAGGYLQKNAEREGIFANEGILTSAILQSPLFASLLQTG